MTLRITPQQTQRLFGAASTRRLESGAAKGLAPHTLMTRAGTSVARLARALAPHAGRYWIFCGPGNNGGDGFEAAFQLQRSGAVATVVFDGDAGRLPTDALRAFEQARGAGVEFVADAGEDVQPRDLCIDALLGIGTRSGGRGARDSVARRLRSLYLAPCPVLAVDLPSGLDADTGQYADGLAPAGPARSARHTLSLLTLKPGLFTGHGRDAAGTVWFDDLGIANDHETPDAVLGGPPAETSRSHASHKGSFGDVSILGGEGIGRRGMGMSGAALLAGSAALHAGAGRVLVALLDADVRLGVDTSQPELMLRTPQALTLDDATLVCGCGGGDAVRDWLPQVLRKAARLVLDADALNAIAADEGLRQTLKQRADRQAVTVLTPHPLEAARLLDSETSTVQADRLAAARALAERHGCVVVLKGSGSVIAAPGLTPAINPTGNGRLATAGTGDVLAGMVGAGLAAAGSGCDLTAAFDAARDAVYRHGAIADAWPAGTPLTAGALARQTPDR